MNFFYDGRFFNIVIIQDSLRQVFAKSHTGGQRIDCVIHFAALKVELSIVNSCQKFESLLLKAVGESCAQPLKYYGNNVTGSANLMEVVNIMFWFSFLHHIF